MCDAVTTHHAFEQPWSMTVHCTREGEHDMHRGTGWGGEEMFTVLWKD